MRPLVYRIEEAREIFARRQWDARMSRFLRAMSVGSDLKSDVPKSVSVYCKSRSWTMFFSPEDLLSLEPLNVEGHAEKLEGWIHTAFGADMLSLSCPSLE